MVMVRSTPIDCCQKTSNTRLQLSKVHHYHIQQAGICPVDAVVFTTVKDVRVCSDPKRDWVKTAVRYIDSMKQQTTAVLTTQGMKQQTTAVLTTQGMKQRTTAVLTTQGMKQQTTENGTLLKSLTNEINTHAKNAERMSARVDTMQGVVRQNKKDINRCLTELDTLRNKVTEMEDRSRRNNIRLINLPTGAEGDDPVGYLRAMLPQWIPTLSNSSMPIEIDRAHRTFSAYTSKPRTMNFRVLRYQDRQAILQGARRAKPKLQNGTPLEFYADYSTKTTQTRNKLKSIRSKLRQRGIKSFLIYPAILKVIYKGEKLSFESPEDAEQFFAGPNFE
ncbi:uncharacterized protein LOC122133667 [Clupea harengus]|uniref:C-C motif chemokine n=1 Tax=Clupea harengus TaxID=7950 RepID=A0A8M1KUC2_CLUHA|nr:uncharacterized protein LOC122133667 [Clupea harengus]